ncbi:MAG: AMP-binding protein, partial [Clostridia bacterium]|nr:AMP-binding protein [Clostridia bacterium]
MEGLWEITLGDLLNKMAERFPDNDAVVYTSRDFRKTYSQFREIVDEAARGFMAMGVKKGDKVAVWATNEPEWMILMFATAKIGATMVTVNTNYKLLEIEYLLKQSDTKVLAMVGEVKGNNYIETINELIPSLSETKPGEINDENLPFLKSILYIGNKEDTPKGMFHWDELYKMAESVSEEELYEVERSIDIHDVVNMQYTSGTTGFPKGVMLTHYNIVNNGRFIGDCMAFSEKDRLCIPVPLFHCFGCVLGVMASVTHGTTMVMVEQFSAIRVLESLQAEKCTAVHGVPTMFISMLAHPDFEKFDLSHMRTGIMAGSPCPEKVMQEVIDKMHMSEICITYGLTESSPAITMSATTDSVALRVSTVGKRMPYCEAKIIDPETGEECPNGVP